MTKQHKQDLGYLILLLLVLALFAYHESRNKNSIVCSSTREVKYPPGNSNTF